VCVYLGVSRIDTWMGDTSVCVCVWMSDTCVCVFVCIYIGQACQHADE